MLEGEVFDEKSTPIAFANIVIMQDGELVTGVITNENGSFKVNNLKASSYIVKVSFLGYQPSELKVDLVTNIKLKKIVLLESVVTLDGITIIAKKPTVKRMIDRLVFNVENSTLSNENVLDVLKHSPGVMVYNGDILVKNASPTVYINDKKVHLSSEEVLQLLEGTPAENIKSIEIITNPPAKYEAEGGAVINIITSKNIVSGYHGSVYGNYKQGSEYGKHSYGTSHFFKVKKINAYLNYNISPRKDFMQNKEHINFLNNSNDLVSRWETDFKRTQEASNQNINANIDYTINDKNILSFSSEFLISPRKNTRKTSNSSTEIFDSNGGLDSIFETYNRRVDETYNLALNIDYVHKFKREGENLSFNLHHTDYDFSNFQNVDTDYLFPDNSLIRENRFQTFSSQIIQLNTSQIDYYLPINDSSEFESGLKTSHIDSESIIDQFIFNNQEREEDFDNSDRFLYNESNYAAYVSYSKNWDKWALKAGLRIEYTDVKGNSTATGKVSNNNYLKAFPSFYLANNLSNKNNVYLSYNKRIYRPRYSQLNPFKYFYNDNTYIIGDPNLKPQIDNVFTLGYTFNNDFTFEVYYRHEDDPTLQYIFQDNVNNQVVYKNTNTDLSYSYGLDFTTYTKVAENWNLYALSSIFYYNNKFYAQDNSSKLLTSDKWSLLVEVANYFSFLKDNSLTANVSYVYLSPTNDGPTDTSEMHGLNVSLKKTFLENRASLSIGLVDAFDTQNYTVKTQYENQDSFIKNSIENRLFTIGFNYKFGNFKLKNNNKQIDLKERNRLD